MKPSSQEHFDWLRDHVNVYVKPLMVDLLKDKPANSLDFMIFWLQTNGRKIEKRMGLGSGDNGENPPREIEHLPVSDDENDDEIEDHHAQRMEAKKSIVKKKLAISAEAYGEYNQLGAFEPKEVPKSEEQLIQIRKTLESSFTFKALDEKSLDIVIRAMVVLEFATGDRVLTQGDDGEDLFILSSGQLACSRKPAGSEEDVFLKNYEPGEVFGELALLYNAPRAATITATEPSVCFSLDRNTFNHIVKNASIQQREKYDLFLNKVEILQELEPYERSKISDCLELETFKKGDEVIKQGETGDTFYLIQDGTAEAVVTDEAGNKSTVLTYSPHDYFGELALLNDETRKATIVATSDTLVVASMSKKVFKRLLGPLEDILKRNSAKYEKVLEANKVSA